MITPGDCHNGTTSQFSFIGVDGTGRNQYQNDNDNTLLIYNSSGGYWAVTTDTGFTFNYNENTEDSTPNPPSLLLGTWTTNAAVPQCAITALSGDVQDQANPPCDDAAVAPTALCSNLTVQLNAAGNASITAADVNGGSTDNCGVASLSAAPTSFTCADVGANTSTLTVTDASGNSSTCNANVTVEDNLAPTAVCLGEAVDLNIATADIQNASNSPLWLSDNFIYGQTFQATATGLLSRIDVEITGTTTPGSIILNLYPGTDNPDTPEPLLGTATFAKSDPGGATVPLIFDSPISITAGTSYLMILSATGFHDLQTTVVLNGDPYPAGTFYTGTGLILLPHSRSMTSF